ncbi:hypothetical protein V8F06_007532 [Rhypophila decipiens]
MEDTTDQSNIGSPNTNISFETAAQTPARLQLVSHAHSPPHQPPPHLKYDLRCIQNPPKALRDSQTGLSKRLREHLLDHQDFQELLNCAEEEIRAAMAAHLAEGRTTNENKDDDDDDETDLDGYSVTLSVAAFCARGHHRSVAFIEELAIRKWPSKWEVRVVHRDLNREKSAHGKKHRDGMGKNRGRQAGGFDLVLGNE